MIVTGSLCVEVGKAGERRLPDVQHSVWSVAVFFLLLLL